MKAAAKMVLRIAPIHRAALGLAGARGRGLVLVYHRLTAETEQAPGIIPSVPSNLFRQQVQAMVELGEVVPLDVLLLAPSSRRRPRFSITFDDDYKSHHDLALPILTELELSAAFFLSGRTLHGLGARWFEVLDQLVRQRGLDSTRGLIGTDARTVEDLAVACERNQALQRSVIALSHEIDEPDALTEPQIAALARANMTIGFHTLRHRLLPPLEDRSLQREVVEGRDVLERAASRAISLFSYPHGKADARTARAVRDSGYRAAVTGRPAPTTRRSDPFLLPRWEPGPLKLAEFVAGLAAKLNRPDMTYNS